MRAEATVKQGAGWGAFAVVACLGVYFFGFIGLAVLCLVIGLALLKSGWSTSTTWVRLALWSAAAVLLALPVLVLWETLGSYQVLTVS